MSVRVEIAGVTVRLFPSRRDAINVANRMTRSANQQHRDVRVLLGYLVKNAVTETYFDDAGTVPLVAVQALLAQLKES